MSLRLYLALGAIGLVLAGMGAIYLSGANAARKAAHVEALEVAVADANKGRAVAVAVADATDITASAALRLHQEAAHGRRDIEALAHTPPAQGAVGAGALVDPSLARSVLCRIGRLRGALPAYCGDPAADPTLEHASDQPVSQLAGLTAG